MKRISAIVSIITVISSLFIIIAHFLPKGNSDELRLFQGVQGDFELISKYLTDTYGTDTKINIGVSFDTGIPVLFGDGDMTLTPTLQDAFSNIATAFKGYDFSFIEITPERISYGGLGCRMYVLARNGEAPDYFYHPGDGVSKACIPLCDGWYLLEHNYR